jgi:rod shape-determining protein MreD
VRIRNEATLFLILIAASLVLQLVPWPETLAPFKPWFLGIVVSYFTLESPGRMTLGFAFVLGLIADVLPGVVLFGEHAFRLTILVYILLRFRYRLRFFPLWQQTAAMGAIFLNDAVLSVWVLKFANYGWPPLRFWLAPFVAMLLWPAIFLSLDRLRQLTRVRTL